MRTERYKLIHYYRVGEWELFDLDKDPDELRSVYSNEKYAPVVRELKAEISRLQKELDEPEPTKPVPGDPELRRRRGRRGRK